MLPAVAECLLADCLEPNPNSSDADLSRFVVVVRGRNAGRHLLGLLAAEAQRRGMALIPPRIVTPGSLDAVLLGRNESVAGRLIQRLAWARVVQQGEKELLDSVWESPSGDNRPMALARFLDQTWQELSASGIDFDGAYHQLCQVAPDASVQEESRWMALSRLLGNYRGCLESWGMVDPADFRLAGNKRPDLGPEAQVVLVGVVELAPALVSLLKDLRNQPRIFIHAPASESDGFDAWGRLVPEYWKKRPCRFEHGEIHVVSDASQQADRCAELILKWRERGLPAETITVAIAEPEALTHIEFRLRDQGIRVRPAEGRPASHSAALQLLDILAECLGSAPDSPPVYSAVARLVRHPDVEGMLGHPAKRLDEYFNAHLPSRLGILEWDSDEQSKRLHELFAKVRELMAIRSESFADDLSDLLLRVYGQRKLNRYEDADRAVIHGLEAVRNALDEMNSISREALAEFSAAELLHVLVESAGGGGIPSPELPDAVELAGWLEAAADDSPALIVTSVFEGCLPEGASAEPLLHDLLRERLRLPCRASRFARDQYTLWTVTESRRGSGQVALIAPRRNATNEPTRPSRLLIAGHEQAELAARLIALSSAPKSNPKLTPGGLGHQPLEPDPERMRQFRVFRPTCFRSYLESPRLFYFKYILGLAEACDDAQELEGGMFGTIVHAVLQEYGERWLGKDVRQSGFQIEADLEILLCGYMERNFGCHALAPVSTQIIALRERLRMFAKHQAVAFEAGWQIAYVESDASLLVPFEVEGAPADVQLKGKIDRIDWHPDGRWRVIDYKTASKAKSPKQAHYPSEKAGWKDLQLPLYLKLLPAIGSLQNGPVDPEKTELVYFNLPPEFDESGITEPFPTDKIDAAMEKAESIVREVCSGEGCKEIGKMSQFADPAFVALCGMNGMSIGNEEEEE